MGANRNQKNFVINARSDGRREFYQHDDRGGGGGYSSNNNNNNNNSNNNNNDRGYSSNNNNERFSNKDFRRQKFSDRGGQHFQNRGNRRGRYNYYRGGGFRKYLQDEDISMSSEGKSNRHQEMYGQSRGGRRGRRGRGGMQYSGNSDWQKITIKEAISYGKEQVLSKLKEYVSDEFSPVLLEADGENVVFYLERSPGVANAISKLSGRSFLGSNHNIRILCHDNPPPDRKLTPPQIEILKNVMAARYSVEMKRLDLKHFHADKTLIREQIFCPLYRHSCLSTVLEVIVANCPHVEEVDLSFNQISNTTDLALLKSCTNLRRLYLEKNRFKSFSIFESLEGLQLVELTLEGNPLCNKFKDPESYINAVRKVFPKVERLDSMDLPKPIVFEVEDDIKLPANKSSYFCSEEARNVVLQFVQQYYQVFESDNRSALEAAYTEEAQMSISANIPENAGAKNARWIEMENRNMKKEKDSEKRHKLLYKGRPNVIKALCRMPKITHDPNSFVIDVPLATPVLMHVVVTGVFKQYAEKMPPHRNFMKSLVIVPVGNGFCISNDELYINTATVEQIRKSFKDTTPLEPVPVAPPQSDSMAGLDSGKAELVNLFAVHTKMLPQYCIMCLEGNSWDFNKAGQMFLDMQKENKIPPEYFGAVV